MCECLQNPKNYMKLNANEGLIKNCKIDKYLNIKKNALNIVQIIGL